VSRIDFTEYIKQRRVKVGLNQTQVAEAMGYTQQYIVRWERGDVKHITEEHLRKWARVLETDVPYLRRILGRDAPAITNEGRRSRTVSDLLRIPDTADGPERRLIQRFAETLIENQGAALLSVFRQWERETVGEAGAADEVDPAVG